MVPTLFSVPGSNEKVVLIAVAGRSNGLGPVLSGNTSFPVINCPPVKPENVVQDIWSSLNVPSGEQYHTTTFPSFYRIQSFITMFTQACHWALSWSRCNSSTSSKWFSFTVLRVWLLMVVIMKNTALWNVMPCSLVEMCLCCQGQCCFHLHGTVLPWRWRQHVVQKLEQISPDTMVSQPRRQWSSLQATFILSSHICLNLLSSFFPSGVLTRSLYAIQSPYLECKGEIQTHYIIWQILFGTAWWLACCINHSPSGPTHMNVGIWIILVWLNTDLIRK